MYIYIAILTGIVIYPVTFTYRPVESSALSHIPTFFIDNSCHLFLFTNHMNKLIYVLTEADNYPLAAAYVHIRTYVYNFTYCQEL